MGPDICWRLPHQDRIVAYFTIGNVAQDTINKLSPREETIARTIATRRLIARLICQTNKSIYVIHNIARSRA